MAGAKADAEATRAAERRAEVFIVLVVVGFIMARRSDDVFWCGAQNSNYKMLRFGDAALFPLFSPNCELIPFDT